MNTKINIPGLNLKNPIMNASGTAGYGKEIEQFYPLDELGAFVTKSCTYEPRFGNPLPRIADAYFGTLNCIGLTNPGVKHVAEIDIPYLVNKYPKLNIVCSIAGATEEEYLDQIAILNKVKGISAYEINISCPNVSNGGMALSSKKELTEQITKKVRLATDLPIYMKLTPSVTNIQEIALAAQKSGANGIVMGNSYQGMRIDLYTGKPILSRKIGGFGGPAIFPMALKVIYLCAQVLNIPIIGVGGVSSAEDVIEMLYAGACAIQIGSMNLIDPLICKKVADNLQPIMKKYKIDDLNKIIKGAHKYE